MHLNRRHVLRTAAVGALGGLLGIGAEGFKQRLGIKLGYSISPNPTPDDLALLRHAGVDAVSIWTTSEMATVEWMIATRKKLEANGVEVYNIGAIDLHCDPAIVLGTKDQDAHIERFQNHLRNLSRAGINYTTYAHMANIKDQPVPGFYATAMTEARPGAPTREFDIDAALKLPNSFDREYSEKDIWASFTKFIRAVMPVAERTKVKIGLHPDDPPVRSLGGVARIFAMSKASTAPWNW